MHSGCRFQNFEILDLEGVLKIYKTQNIFLAFAETT